MAIGRRNRVAREPAGREEVVTERRNPISRFLGGVASFIGWTVLLLVALIVLLIVLL